MLRDVHKRIIKGEYRMIISTKEAIKKFLKEFDKLG